MIIDHWEPMEPDKELLKFFDWHRLNFGWHEDDWRRPRTPRARRREEEQERREQNNETA